MEGFLEAEEALEDEVEFRDLIDPLLDPIAEPPGEEGGVA